MVQNELVPRANKLGMALDEFFDPKMASVLVYMEREGVISRNDLREIFDRRVAHLEKHKHTRQHPDRTVEHN